MVKTFLRLTQQLPFFASLLIIPSGPGTTFSSTAYATMKGHLFRGEERVTVALRDYDQSVDIEVVSISRPAPTMFARGIWPLIGKKQNTFFEQQMDFLKGVAMRNGDNQDTKESFFSMSTGRINHQNHLVGNIHTNTNQLDFEF